VPGARDPFDADCLVRYVPAWLPSEQREQFLDRLSVALKRYRAAHGEFAFSNVLRFGSVVGGVAAAFKANRLTSAWGRRMFGKRGAKGRLRAIAEAGEQRRAVFAEIGRLGGLRSGAVQRTRNEAARLASAHPHIQSVLRGTARTTKTRSWMAM
jgi:hypothetical protein